MQKQAAYWSYRATHQTPDLSDLPPGSVAMTDAEWESLSPGMRRDIYRSFTGKYPPLEPTRRELKAGEPRAETGLNDLFE